MSDTEAEDMALRDNSNMPRPRRARLRRDICGRCGLASGDLLDLDTGGVYHPELWDCIVALRMENQRLQGLTEAQDSLLVCYRLGKRPSEALLDRLAALRARGYHHAGNHE